MAMAIEDIKDNSDWLVAIGKLLEEYAVNLTAPSGGGVWLREQISAELVNLSVILGQKAMASKELAQFLINNPAMMGKVKPDRMPGSQSSKLKSVVKNLRHIMCLTPDVEIREIAGNEIERLKNLEEQWCKDEEDIRDLSREMRLMGDSVLEHKMLFFGPNNPGTELANDMERNKILQESQIADVLNGLSKEGWRVVHRSFNPEFVMEQWRILLERPFTPTG